MNKFLTLLLAVSFSAVASNQFNTIDTVEVTEITENEDGTLSEAVISKQSLRKSNAEYAYDIFESNTDPKKEMTVQDVGKVLSVAEDLVALGQDVYKLVQLGKPVVNVDTAPISVLPMSFDKSGPVAALSLSNWKMPKVKKYRLKVKNYLGFTAIDFRWKIIFNFGGQYNEKGAFITGAIIKPEHVDVIYGYDLNVSYKLQSISNTGSKENPVAQAIIDFDYKFETVLKTTIQSHSYLINGMGGLKTL